MAAIGEVARLTGLKIPTIRFYEQEGLLPAPERTPSGRRVYDAQDVSRLAFIRHARALGFELDDIRSLLDLSDRPHMPCGKVDEIARTHLAIVDERIAQLTQLKDELYRIVRSCRGGKSVSDCRIIGALGDIKAVAGAKPVRTGRGKKSA